MPIPAAVAGMTADTLSIMDAIKRRLEELESEKRELLAELARLERGAPAQERATRPLGAAVAVSAGSDGAAKINISAPADQL